MSAFNQLADEMGQAMAERGADDTFKQLLQGDFHSPSAVESATRAEVDIQISTANRFPRSLRMFMKEAESMVSMDEGVAESCLYALKRNGRDGQSVIQGPSARFAEIIAIAWRNLRITGRIVGDDGKMLTGQGMCLDLERNVGRTVEVKRRVTTARGQRYSDDMVVVTGNAAISIAARNAVLQTIPKAYWNPIYLKARDVSIGKAETLLSKRQKMVEYFSKMGVDVAQICEAVGKKGEEEIGLEELAVLKGFATAIKEGDQTVDEIFPPLTPVKKEAPAAPLSPPAPAKPAEAPVNRADQVAEKLAAPAPAPAAAPASASPAAVSEAAAAPASPVPSEAAPAPRRPRRTAAPDTNGDVASQALELNLACKRWVSTLSLGQLQNWVLTQASDKRPEVRPILDAVKAEAGVVSIGEASLDQMQLLVASARARMASAGLCPPPESK